MQRKSHILVSVIGKFGAIPCHFSLNFNVLHHMYHKEFTSHRFHIHPLWASAWESLLLLLSVKLLVKCQLIFTLTQSLPSRALGARTYPTTPLPSV